MINSSKQQKKYQLLISLTTSNIGQYFATDRLETLSSAFYHRMPQDEDTFKNLYYIMKDTVTITVSLII